MIRRKDARQRAMMIAALIMSAALSFYLVFGFIFVPAGVSDAAESGVSLSLPEGYLEAVGGDAEDAVTDLLGIPEAVLLVRELLAGADTAALKSDPIVVAVIDTGVQTGHEVFGTGTAENVFLTKSGNIVARNTLNNTSDVRDGASKDYHGTHVTGIVALLIRAFGLADYIKIIPIKAGEYYAGKGNNFYDDDVTAGVDFALANGADVVNLSIGSDNAAWQKSVTASDAEEAVFVAAAGNYHDDSDSVFGGKFYPAANDHVIGVMNCEVDEDGAKMHVAGQDKGSNYGSAYEVCAPGTDIMSADGGNMGYKTLTGTSMASPVVSFAVALLELKCRAEGFDADAEELREMFLLTFTDTLEYDGEDYPLLDLAGLMNTEFARDASGGIYLEQASATAAAYSAAPLVLGTPVPLTLFADCGYLDAGAKYEWSFLSGGTFIKAEGARLNTSIVATDINGVDVTLKVYTPDGSTLLAESTAHLIATYLTPTASNSRLTMSVRAGADGRVRLGNGDDIVLGVTSLQYASPETRVVWEVNGKEASRDHSFTFRPDADGTYVISVTVNDIAIGEDVIVVAEGIDDARRAVVIGCSVAGAALVAAAGVITAIVMMKRRAEQREGSPSASADGEAADE